MRPSRRYVLLIAASLTLIAASHRPAHAQNRRFADKPFIRAWFNGVTEESANEYVRGLFEEYELSSSFMSQALDAAKEQVEDPPELQGLLVYMAQGIIPSVAQVQFRTVEDERGFRHQVRRLKTQFGDAATLTGGDDHYVVELDFTQGIPIPGVTTESDEENEDDDDSGKVTRIPIDDSELKKNPELMARLKVEYHFRLIGNVMFQGDVPELMDMDLPDLEQLRPSDDQNAFDILLDLDLAEIPFGYKNLLFNVVKNASNTFLQQVDDEEQLEYNARRATGEMALEILRAAVFDLEKGRFSIQFADEDRPVRIRLDLEAKPGSDLSKLGERLGGADSRFGAISNRPAPLTLGSTWGMPKLARTFFEAQIELARNQLESDPDVADGSLHALDNLQQSLDDTVEAGRFDVMAQIAGNASEGFAIVGGILLKDAEQFRDSLAMLLSNLPQTSSRIDESHDESGRTYFRLETGDVTIPGLDRSSGTAIHFTTFDSCLWIAAGGPAARQILTDTILQAEEHRRDRQSGEPFQLGFDLSEWLEESDDTDGFGQYPRRALLNAERRLDDALSKAMPHADSGTSAGRRISFLEKALSRGGDEIDLRIRASEDGFDLDLDVGLGIANLIVARLVDLQGRAIEMMNRAAKNGFRKPEQSKSDDGSK